MVFLFSFMAAHPSTTFLTPVRKMLERWSIKESSMLTEVFERYQRALLIEPICGRQQRVEAGRKVALALRGDYTHS